MAASLLKLKISLLLILFLPSVLCFAKVPPTCKRMECPSYDVIHNGPASKFADIIPQPGPLLPPFNIFLMVLQSNKSIWLFDYIQGKNSYKQKIEMTAPVITEVEPSDGPFCESSFVVSFYVPKKNQANPPSILQRVSMSKDGSPVYAAVQQFVKDSNVGEEAASLNASIAGTKWASMSMQCGGI